MKCISKEVPLHSRDRSEAHLNKSRWFGKEISHLPFVILQLRITASQSNPRASLIWSLAMRPCCWGGNGDCTGCVEGHSCWVLTRIKCLLFSNCKRRFLLSVATFQNTRKKSLRSLLIPLQPLLGTWSTGVISWGVQTTLLAPTQNEDCWAYRHLCRTQMSADRWVLICIF